MTAPNTPEQLQSMADESRRDVLTPGLAVIVLSHAEAHLNQRVRKMVRAEDWRDIREAVEIIECLRMLVLYTMVRPCN
jgi:hypothetical protein